MKNQFVYKDAFNLLCGRKIASGTYRDVFECKLRPEFVVKVEPLPENGYRTFHNVLEHHFWCEHQHYKAVAQWLAPIEYSSPDCRILLQRRVQPIIDDAQFPAKLPAFLTDTKRANFGILDGRFVCVDYALTINNPSVRMQKAEFWE